MSNKSGDSDFSGGGGGCRNLLRLVSRVEQRICMSCFSFACILSLFYAFTSCLKLNKNVHLLISIRTWVVCSLVLQDNYHRKIVCFCLSQRPVDWLEEADRQLYLTTPTTGNYHEGRPQQRRRIDFVLVYSLGVRDSIINKQRRQAFQQRLESVGFIIEEQDIVGGLVNSIHWKVHF